MLTTPLVACPMLEPILIRARSFVPRVQMPSPPRPASSKGLPAITLQGSSKKKAFYMRKRLKLDQFLALMGDARDHQNSMTIAQQKIALKASRTSLKRVRGARPCSRLLVCTIFPTLHLQGCPQCCQAVNANVSEHSWQEKCALKLCGAVCL